MYGLERSAISEVDSVTKQLYPLCDCSVAKYLNSTPPLDRSSASHRTCLESFEAMADQCSAAWMLDDLPVHLSCCNYVLIQGINLK